MFGHQDENQDQASDQSVTATAPPPANDNPQPDNADNPSDDNAGYLDHLASEVLDQDHPEVNQPENAEGDADSSDDSPSDDSSNNSSRSDNDSTGLASDDLLDIKKQALGELSPLVGHLDQTPEEKFKTTMMMIQAADNQSLIPDAYKAAKDISDEKARAQALLDIVNEINYFTHKN